MKDHLNIHLSRRRVLKGGSAAALALAGAALVPTTVKADAKAAEEAVMKAAGGKTPTEGRITIGAPQIAENGNTVPISVAVDSPMTASDYVKTVHVFADGNPSPQVAAFHFQPGSVANVSTRMRMAKTQNVIAVAEMSDGSVFTNKVQVKVTIGGCGG